VRHEPDLCVAGQRHVTRATTPVDKAMKEVVDKEIAVFVESLKEQLCITETELDVTSSHVRLQEVSAYLH
jgi:hypothetical protein